VKKNKKHYYSETSRGYIKSSKKETIIYKKLTQLGKIFETEKEFGVCYPGSILLLDLISVSLLLKVQLDFI